MFVCIVYVLTALFVFSPKTDYSSSEKRYLEDFPAAFADSGSSDVLSTLNKQPVLNGEFEKSFETYFSDHFPMRNMWVGLNAYSSLATGNNGSNGVYNCSDGYLINVPVREDNRVDMNLAAITDFKNNVDVPVTAMFAPSTGYIMSDKLPAVHNEYRDDVYFNNAKNTLSAAGIDFVDLRARFKTAHDNKTKLYYRTDHHWTTAGAYTAYVQLVKSLGLKPVKKSAFDIEKYGGFYGTTYSTSGFWLTEPDIIEVWNNKKNDGKITVVITEGDESKSYDSMYFKNHLDEDDKYPVFLDGNHALETITNSRVKSGKALVIKDSFAHCLAPFLAENFNTVTTVDMRYYKNSVSDLVKEGGYDRVFVIYGIDNFATDSDLVWLS